ADVDPGQQAALRAALVRHGDADSPDQGDPQAGSGGNARCDAFGDPLPNTDRDRDAFFWRDATSRRNRAARRDSTGGAETHPHAAKPETGPGELRSEAERPDRPRL